MFGWFLHSLHHQHQQHHVTTQIPANNLHNAIFTMFVLAWILSCFPTCWKKHAQWVMLAKAFPRLVGRVKLVWNLSEFWWWKVQLEYGYVWMVSPLTSPPTPPTPPAAPRNHTEYQQQLVQWNFPHVCSCMGSVLVYNMLKETGTVDYFGQGFREVGWYGKTCLNSLLNLLVESAVRI